MACICLCLALGLSLSAQQPGTITDEDVVRGFVGGQSAAQLIELIERSDVDFDLSDEMLDELRAAGLPAAVIDAMRRRQAVMDAALAPPEPEVADAAPTASLVVVLNPDTLPAAGAEPADDAADASDADTDDDKRRVLRFLDLIPQGLHADLSLGAEDLRFTDAAIFLGCTRTEHVPDHWRSQTPLGRDFVNAPRHRLLAWSSGVRKVDTGKLSKIAGKLAPGPERGETAVLELDLPPQLEGALEPGDTHDLILGVALEAGGRFFVMTLDAWDDVRADGPLTATIKAGGSLHETRIEVHFRR